MSILSRARRHPTTITWTTHVAWRSAERLGRSVHLGDLAEEALAATSSWSSSRSVRLPVRGGVLICSREGRELRVITVIATTVADGIGTTTGGTT